MLNTLLTNTNTGNDAASWVVVVILIGVMVAFMVMNSRSQKKRAQETQEMLNAIGPGNKVKTIGGICGIVVEVNPEDNTFVLETGSETHGKSYIKFDKQAVYQTDAVAKKEEAAPVEAPVEEETAAPAEEVFEEIAPEAVEETVEETAETTEE